MGDHKRNYLFPDHNQNFWQLASIQSASMGIPGLIVGADIAVKYGMGTAITSIVIGNLILWLIGLAMITMAASGKNNALQNINHYLGKAGGGFAAFFLILAFLSWYLIQLDSASAAIQQLLLPNANRLRIGAGMGAFIALLSMGGIRLIKHYSVFVFPFLLAFVVCTFFVLLPHLDLDLSWGFSFLGTITVVLLVLPGFVNLPTFFRHSRSQYDSYLGLSLTIFFAILFQVYGVIVDFKSFMSIGLDHLLFSIALISFVTLTLISVNLVNIYFASAGWEILFPHRKTNKEFVVVGLLGTLSFTFLQITKTMESILTIANNFISGIGFVLILAFLMRTFSRHRPQAYEKGINLSCWFLGGIVGGVVMSVNDMNPSKILIIIFSVTTLAFLFVVFFEETYKSIRNLLKKAFS